MTSPVGDILYLQTADGKELFVPDDEFRMITYGNFGAPPVSFITRKGYKQHGSIEVDYLLEPRTISVRLWRAAGCTRQQYWDNRLALHDFLRHNRGGPLTFVLRQPGGEKRALVVRANPGLQFPMPDADSNNWSVDEVIDFVAFNPIFFDPETPAQYITSQIIQNLVFPITFPIEFGSIYPISRTTITYQGTWQSYPIITVFGPYTQAIIQNGATGVRFDLSVAIDGAERREIDLTPGQQSVRDGFGNNRFSDLGPASNLVDFALKPDPEVPGGVQVIQGTFIGGAAGVTAMQVSYYERFFAL